MKALSIVSSMWRPNNLWIKIITQINDQVETEFYFLYRQIVVFSLIVFAKAFPVADDEKRDSLKFGSNLLFQQLNEILKREITKEVKDDSLEIGDKYNGNDGKFQIQIQQFSANQGFPVFFKPKDEEVLEDKVITALVSDIKGLSEYEIKTNDSGEKEDEITTERISESTTSSPLTTTSKKAEDNESTTEKNIVAKIVESTPAQTTSPSSATNKN